MSIVDCIMAKAKNKESGVKQEFADDVKRIYDEEFAARGSEELATAATMKRIQDDYSWKKRRTLQQITKLDEVQDYLAQFEDNPRLYAEAVLGLIDQNGNEPLKGRPSIEGARKSIRDQANGRITELLEAHRKGMLGQNKDKAGLVHIVKELFGENSGNANAKVFAKAFQDVAEELRQRFNAAGGNIGKHRNWGIRTKWNGPSLMEAKRETWIADAMDRVDWDLMAEKSGISYPPEKRSDILNQIYDDITGIADDGKANIYAQGHCCRAPFATQVFRVQDGRRLALYAAEVWERG